MTVTSIGQETTLASTFYVEKESDIETGRAELEKGNEVEFVLASGNESVDNLTDFDITSEEIIKGEISLEADLDTDITAENTDKPENVEEAEDAEHVESGNRVGERNGQKKTTADKNYIAQNERKNEQSDSDVEKGDRGVEKREGIRNGSDAAIDEADTEDMMTKLGKDIKKLGKKLQKGKDNNQKIKKNLQKTFKRGTKNSLKMKKDVTKIKADLKKLKAEASKNSNQGAPSVSADSTTQSGSTLGFEGQLRTDVTQGSVSSDTSSGQKSGGIKNIDKILKEVTNTYKKMAPQELKMKNVATAQTNAMAPYLAAAEGAREDAEGYEQSASDLQSQETKMYASAGGAAVAGAALYMVGSGEVAAGQVTLAIGQVVTSIGIAMQSNPLTAAAGKAMEAKGTAQMAAGTAVITKGQLMIAGALVALGAAYALYQNGTQKGQEADGEKEEAKGCIKEAEEQDKMAEKEGKKAKKEAKAYNQAQLNNQRKVAQWKKEAASLSNKSNSGAPVGMVAGNASPTAGTLGNSELDEVTVDGKNEEALEELKMDRETQIMDHEMAHAMVCGGTPVIEYDANGIAIGGYVEIDVPSVDEDDLEGTIEKAQMVIEAALAPIDPSGQDISIANEAEGVLAEALTKLEEKAELAESDEVQEDEMLLEESQEAREEFEAVAA